MSLNVVPSSASSSWPSTGMRAERSDSVIRRAVPRQLAHRAQHPPGERPGHRGRRARTPRPASAIARTTSVDLGLVVGGEAGDDEDAGDAPPTDAAARRASAPRRRRRAGRPATSSSCRSASRQPAGHELGDRRTACGRGDAATVAAARRRGRRTPRRRTGTLRRRNVSKIARTSSPNGSPVVGIDPLARRRSSSTSWACSCSISRSTRASCTWRVTRTATTRADGHQHEVADHDPHADAGRARRSQRRPASSPPSVVAIVVVASSSSLVVIVVTTAAVGSRRRSWSTGGGGGGWRRRCSAGGVAGAVARSVVVGGGVASSSSSTCVASVVVVVVGVVDGPVEHDRTDRVGGSVPARGRRPPPPGAAMPRGGEDERRGRIAAHDRHRVCAAPVPAEMRAR